MGSLDEAYLDISEYALTRLEPGTVFSSFSAKFQVVIFLRNKLQIVVISSNIVKNRKTRISILFKSEND